VNAAVFVGGLGTRLRSVAPVKALAPLGAGTLLSYQLDRLAPLQPERVVLLAGHAADALPALPGVEIRTEPSPLGTAGALHGLGPGTWLVLNVDHVSDLDLPGLLAAHDGRATAVVHPIQHQIPQGVVTLAGDQVVAYRERPTLDLWVTVGAYVFDGDALRGALDGSRCDMPELIQRLAPVRRFVHAGTWFDAGTPSRLAAADAWLRQG
jgi:NDP-sugar pyrophosphorylase family protein